MTTIQASEFKAKCLALMDQVALTGECIVITKNGKPVAELKPYGAPRANTLFGLYQDEVIIQGDILGPVEQGTWNAFK